MRILLAVLFLILGVLSVIGAATLYIIIVTIQDDRERESRIRNNNSTSE